MDTVQNFMSDATTPSEAPKQKGTKRRFSKLTANEIAGLPGANLTVVKKVEPDVVYSLCFAIPIFGVVGSVMENSQVQEFAAQLDLQAKAKAVGFVSEIRFSDSQAGVVLKLHPIENMTSHGVPATNAFAQLKDFLDVSPLLRQGGMGKTATWKAKVNGTTLVDGRY